MHLAKGIFLATTKAESAAPFLLAVGQVINKPDQTSRQVKVIKMEMDDYLKMYFNKSYEIMSVDNKNESRVGDIVLIHKLKNPKSPLKAFEIEKVLFKIDDIIDPITGKKLSHDNDIMKEHLDKLLESMQQPEKPN
jgi:small subunit ribosomal protein S17